MDLNRAIYFWTTHNASIIQWLLFFICGMSMVLIFRVVVRKKSDSSDIKVPDLNNLESSLRKIIETSIPKASPATTVEDPKAMAELQTLKALITEKEAEIAKLKTSDTGSAELESKLRTLEARLAEYQILEDDIADLTRYKKENEELKAQLSGQPAAPPTTPEPAAAAAAAQPAAEAAPAAEPPPVATAEPTAAEAAPAAADAASALPGPDLVAEFQATVQEQKKLEVDDLLGEFSTEQKSS